VNPTNVGAEDHPERLLKRQQAAVHQRDHQDDGDRRRIEDSCGDGAREHADQRVGRKAAEELARPFAGERLDPARQLQHAKQKQDQTADDFERNG